MPFEILRNDITRMQVDAIVNSANPRAVVGGGVDGAIHRVAGPELLAARKKIGDIATGTAAITPAYNLNAKYVIHTVGPVWRDGNHGERELLEGSYKNSLQLAADNDCASIAFPIISAGIFGCPAEISISTAMGVIREFLQEHEMEVYLVVFDQKSFRISKGLFDSVQDYLDARYIEEFVDEEYEAAKRYRRLEMARAPECFGDEEPFIGEALPMSAGATAAKEKSRSLEDLLDEMDDTFSESLLRLIDVKGKTDPEVYKRANVDRKHFSKIRNNPKYQPSKSTALAFAVALELNLDETRDFIGRAGYALSHSSKSDIIVEYFIEQKEYDIFTINEALFAFEQPLLGG